MEQFDNSPINKGDSRNEPVFQGLKMPQSKDAIAFMRSGLGEEVLPGFFILNKDIALAVTALRIVPDEEFLAREAEMAQTANIEGRIYVKDVVKEASALFDRLEQKINTSRGIFLVGTQPMMQTNLLTLALPELPQFKKSAEHIVGAVNHITRGETFFVTEGAQWNKKDLILMLLAHRATRQLKDGFALVTSYDTVKSTLEATPGLLNRLQEEGIVPPMTPTTTAFRFWAEAFSTSKCADNQPLHSWIRSCMDWQPEMEKITNDGVFIGALIAQTLAANHDSKLSAALESFIPVNALGAVLAHIADTMSQASVARVARSN